MATRKLVNKLLVKKGPVQVEIKPHPRYPDSHWLCLVHTRGRVWFITSAEPKPTEAQVLDKWRTERHEFQPYRG